MTIKWQKRKKQLEKLLLKLGLVDFKKVDLSLLDLALTHPSFSKTNNYQVLEFVGDSVIRLLAAQVLLETYPKASLGEYASIRSILVSDRLLAEIGESYGIKNYMLLSETAAADKIGKTSILADAFEAILGALYLSTNTMELIRPWLDPVLKEKAEEINQDPAKRNYKDALQEWTQAQYRVLPKYVVKNNPKAKIETDKFIAEVWLKDQNLGTGIGRTKKAAQQAAAKQAFLLVSNKEKEK